MGKIRKALDIDICGGLTEEVTPWAGVSLLVELFRRVGVGAMADKVLAKKKSPQGLSQGQMVESFVLLSALGGECVDDMGHLRGDKGLEALTGHEMPAASTARQWLDRFHEEELLTGCQHRFIFPQNHRFIFPQFCLQPVALTSERPLLAVSPSADSSLLEC